MLYLKVYLKNLRIKNDNNLILHGKEKRNKNCKVKKLIIGTGIIPPKKLLKK